MVEAVKDAWAVVVVLNNLDMSLRAIQDLCAQTGVKPRLLVIDNGSDPATADALKEYCAGDDQVLLWVHNPPLPSLAATWNRALDFCWEVGAQEALVSNNDVSVRPDTYHLLRDALRKDGALFVSAVGVREGWEIAEKAEIAVDYAEHRGGPDFSHFLISKEGHTKYRFDEEFIPAYTEDIDMHRRMMLGGDGARIYSVLVPYFHHGSATIKQFSPERAAAFHRAVAGGSRAHFSRKWGGPVNSECWNVPFGGEAPRDGACTTTPDLQRHSCGGSHPSDDIQHAPDAPLRSDI